MKATITIEDKPGGERCSAACEFDPVLVEGQNDNSAAALLGMWIMIKTSEMKHGEISLGWEWKRAIRELMEKCEAQGNFSGLTFFPGGNVMLAGRHGVKGFRSLEELEKHVHRNDVATVKGGE